MGRGFGSAIVTLLVAAAIVVLVGLAFIYPGIYNVAASAGHSAFGRWLLQTTQENSIRAYAAQVGAAQPVSEEQLRHGIEHFHNTCVQCHGAPGMERGELGKGITPTPPELSKAARQWTEQELFWIVKHGIKLAGMPAFGVTHSDEELWALVAFLRRLPETTAHQYRQMTAGLEQRHAEAHGAKR